MRRSIYLCIKKMGRRQQKANDEWRLSFVENLFQNSNGTIQNECTKKKLHSLCQ